MSTFPGAFVPVAPPADGLRLAFVAARRRRNRKAGATGAAGLLAAVALLASTGGGGSSTTLQQEPLPPSTSGLGLVIGGADPSAAPLSTAAPVTPSQGDLASAPRSGVFDPAGTQDAEAGADHQTTAASSSGLRTKSTPPVSGPMSRSTGFFYTGNDLMCPARKQQERQRGLCTDIYVTQSSTNTMTITAEVCNVGTATEMLSYATARELDVSVRRSGLDVWRWSLGRHFAATPHEITVGTQECVMWQTDWAQVDSHGVRVKAGDFTVVADLDADEVAGPDRHPSYPFTIQPQS